MPAEARVAGLIDVSEPVAAPSAGQDAPPTEGQHESPTRARSPWRSRLFWSAAVVLLALDLWSKQWAFARLGVDPSEYSTIEEFYGSAPRAKEFVAGEWLRLVTMLNPGMMWGAFQDHPGILRVIRPLAVLVIFFLLHSLPTRQPLARAALGGVLGGAIGNIWDSFQFLGVRDFIEVRFEGIPLFDPFPAFNVADSAICVGVGVLALGMMRAPAPPAGEAAAPPPA
jgi:signal peptidase II